MEIYAIFGIKMNSFYAVENLLMVFQLMTIFAFITKVGIVSTKELETSAIYIMIYQQNLINHI